MKRQKNGQNDIFVFKNIPNKISELKIIKNNFKTNGE